MRQLRSALAEQLPPVSLGGNTVAMTLELPEDLAKDLDERAAALGLGAPALVGGLLLAQGRSTRPAVQEGQALPDLVLEGLRPGQVDVVEAVAPRLAQGQFALIEAGTGAGKSRIIAHLAAHVLALRDSGYAFTATKLAPADRLLQPYSPQSPAGRAVTAWAARQGGSPAEGTSRAVIVAAPTLANVMHLALEYQRVAPTVDPTKRWTLGVVLGRRQFVSPSAVEELLAQQESPDPAVMDWARNGFPPGAAATSRLLAGRYPGLFGLAEDLRELATNFPVEDALLTSNCPLDEQEWYFALRQIAQGCDIVAVTHAMLALDNRNIHQDRATLLPAPLAVFIDEAHAFEATQADSASKTLSLILLKAALHSPAWSTMRCASAAKRASTAADRAYAALRAVPEPIRLPVDLGLKQKVLVAWDAAKATLADLQLELKALVKGAGKKATPGQGQRQLAEVVAAREAIAALLKGLPGKLSFSHAARYPHVVVGPRSVDAVLATRWEGTPCGALLSGTLLMPSAAGRQAAPIIRRLALPPARTGRPVETHPHWIRSTPTLYTPDKGYSRVLTPPTGAAASAGALEAWVGEVATVITKQVAPSAGGGTLVLLTSYERLRLLEERLRQVPELAGRVIAQEQLFLPMAQALNLFKNRALAGDRPIWLGLGSAWTGIDIRDERFGDDEAGRDMLLTDVVIPAIPFGLNQTTTQAARVNFSGFHAQAVEAVNTFCQGIGRLVRREGLRDRRLWVLDGRLAGGGLVEFNRVLSAYSKQVKLTSAAAPSQEVFFSEGAQRSGQETGYERSPAARRACLAHHGYRCAACSFDFGQVYGAHGKDYIHVHHLTPLAASGGEHLVDPVKDMRPVCANCHAMLHRSTPPMPIEELQKLLKLQRAPEPQQLEPLYS